MAGVIRFGISLEEHLLKDFDRLIKEKKYSNRSEAIRDLIRDSLVKEEWKKGKEVAGAISIVYDHHKRELMDVIVDIQHDYQDMIVASQHAHLDHHNCLEVIIVKGKSDKIKVLADKLRAVKGVKHGSLTLTTLGKEL
ncbi:MAG: nickel-responsive transcriptional regulator NikR [Candidatus Omnitrophica bacterium]|nr:nickel-responsive transcriptional regulator NikR [Candidatus Omnitrophota bacterium]MBU4589665.1 nickel-responsive transcriptional regulator NikR [Candidatus Omnitrophota bacterium]